MARPTKCTEEMIQKASYYVKNWHELGETTPSLVGLALHCEIADSTLYDWAKNSDKNEMQSQFSDIVTRVGQLQHKELLNSGLDGSFNPVITKLILSKHGYSDRQEVDKKTTIIDERKRIVFGKSKSSE